jgi:TatD DNase family protein
MAPIIDFHTHSKREINNIVEVISVHPGLKETDTWHTMGYHPWWTTQPLTDEALDVLYQQYKIQPNCLGIGECGLDKLKGVALNIQEVIFQQHIELANQLHAPLIVHCVRAYDRLLILHKKFAKTPWVIHGYMRNFTLAQTLLQAGIYLSVAPAAQLTSVFKETLHHLPLEKTFLETDSETSLNISQRYAIFAALRQIELPELQEQLFSNFKTFFAWKYPLG